MFGLWNMNRRVSRCFQICSESVIAVNDDTSFPDTTVGVKTDLMSLMQLDDYYS